MSWKITFYSVALEDEILKLSAGFVARFLRYAERMAVYGPDPGMPHTPGPWATVCSSFA
jgi:hypothetical protein